MEEPGTFLFSDPVALTVPPLPADLSSNLDAGTGLDFARPNIQIQAAYSGKVVVLVDETNQSQAEYTTMALRAAGAIVVGSTTAGADGNVSLIQLPGGFHALISGVGVYYPDKRPTQRIGIMPDIVVRPTLADIGTDRDEVIEVALHQILGVTNPPPKSRTSHRRSPD